MAKADKPIITSLLDTDFYKYTMGQVIYNNFSDATTKIKFKCRTKEWDKKLSNYIPQIKEEIQHLCTLRLTESEVEFLRNIPFFNNGYIEFLRLLQLNENFINVSTGKDGVLEIEAIGHWLYTTWFEIYVLAIVQEIYTRGEYPYLTPVLTQGSERLHEKIRNTRNFFKNKANFSFADFGTRRRFSFDWHKNVIELLTRNLSPTCFVGTSNVLFAKEYELTPIGTMAHEYLQAGQAMDCRLVNSQKYMLQKWAETFKGKLGIALSDVVGFDAFLRDFDSYFAHFFSGCRHDSGDPFEWGEKLIAHYEKLGIPPTSKTAVFSDGLDFDLIFKLIERFRTRINTSFGIGTNLTNDMGDSHPALQLVMKMVECNGSPVAKISDSAGKGMCEDPKYLKYLKKVFQIKDKSKKETLYSGEDILKENVEEII